VKGISKVAAVALLVVGCGAKSNGVEDGSASAAVVASAAPITLGTGTGTVTSTAPTGAATATATAAASAAPTASAAPAAPPGVEVKNIGMHIGGGPNDNETKAPIKRSVDPHMDKFAVCFGKADVQDKGGDVSVDLRIDKAGGKAELKKYKSGIDGKAFEDCVRETFAAIDFEKPKTGTTVVSYSLRFSPKKN
jgi:hypothetical protein